MEARKFALKVLKQCWASNMFLRESLALVSLKFVRILAVSASSEIVYNAVCRTHAQ